MSEPYKAFADPIRTVMFIPKCLYCGKKETYWAKCMYQLSIIACNEHKAFADRDVKAWNHRNNRVKWIDYTTDILFKETDILIDRITVKRTSGDIEDDWILIKPDFYEMAPIKKHDGIWLIGVKKIDETIIKAIPVEDLKMSITEEKHGLVDDLIAKLDDGFYKKENLEYNQLSSAYIPAEENPNSIAPFDVPQLVFDNVYVEGHGIVRVIPQHKPILYKEDVGPTDPIHV